MSTRYTEYYYDHVPVSAHNFARGKLLREKRGDKCCFLANSEFFAKIMFIQIFSLLFPFKKSATTMT